MAKLINFDDLSKDIYINIDESNGEIFDIDAETLNIIEREKKELQSRLMSKYKNVDKINCISFDCFNGYVQEITITSHSPLFDKAIEKIINYQVNHRCFQTSYDFIKLYNDNELVDECETSFNLLLSIRLS